MSTSDFVDLDVIGRSGAISDGDVLAMRRAFFEDGTISTQEAEQLFTLDAACTGESDVWSRFFVEAMVDYVVRQAEPKGYVDGAQADWLMRQVTRDGRVNSHTELELLVKICEEATEAPEALRVFALNAVKTAVLEGDGALLGGDALDPRVINDAEVALLQRILFSMSGSGNVGISRAEAEVLFDLNDATLEDRNCAAWSDLFAKAILSHLMAANHYQAPSREEAMRLDAWVNEPAQGVGGFLGSMLSGLGSVKDVYRELKDDDGRQMARLEKQHAAVMAAEPVTGSEIAWLADRIGRDGVLHENEKAVLRFIKNECGEIHGGLEALLARV